MIVLDCFALLVVFAVVFNLQTVLGQIRRLTHWLTRSTSSRQVRIRKMPRNRVAYALRKAHAGR